MKKSNKSKKRRATTKISFELGGAERIWIEIEPVAPCGGRRSFPAPPPGMAESADGHLAAGEDAPGEGGPDVAPAQPAPMDTEAAGDSMPGPSAPRRGRPRKSKPAPAKPDSADPVDDWKPPRPIGDDDPLAKTHGPAIVRTAGKRGAPNHEFIAAYFLRETKSIFDEASGKFHAYEPGSGLWKPVSNAAHMAALSRTYREVLTGKGGEYLLAGRTDRVLRQISRMAANLSSRDGAFGQRADRIHVANGMLRIGEDGTVELLPFSPDFRSRNQCPVPWRPKAKCPEFLSAIGQVLAPDDLQALRMYFGQCLLGGNPTQVFLILRGPAGLMKSTLQQILVKLVGAKNVESLRPGHLGGRFELARFVGMQLLVAADVASDFLATKGANIVKSLTGGDMLTVERKGSNDSIAIRGDFNVCITSNPDMRVRLEGDRDAYARRFLILDFRGSKPARAIPDFAAHIVAKEGPGILRWAVEGAVELLQAIKATGRFPRSPAQLARIEELLDQSDSAAAFVSKCVLKDAGADVSTKELYASYEDFCGLRGWAGLNEREFQLKLPRLMKTHFQAWSSQGLLRDSKHVRGYRGVRLVEPLPGNGTDETNTI